MQKLYILTECSPIVGFGHICRCLPFYDSFENNGLDVSIIIQGELDDTSIVGQCKIIFADWMDDKVDMDFISKTSILFIDSISASQLCIDRLYAKTNKISIIDDYARRKYSNTIVIDWTPGVEKDNSQTHNIGNGNTLLLGLSYSILRGEFVKKNPRSIHETVRKISLIMGGTDIRRLSQPLTEFLARTFPNVDFTCIIGLKQNFYLSNNKNVTVRCGLNAKEMYEEFSSSDIVISAGGQTLLELAALRIPTIPIQIIDNQQYDLKGLVNIGLFDEVYQWDDAMLYEKIANKTLSLMGRASRELYLKKFHQENIGNGLECIVNKILLQHAE